MELFFEPLIREEIDRRGSRNNIGVRGYYSNGEKQSCF